MHFNPDRSRKILAIGITASMLVAIGTACSIDYKALGEGLNDLGNAVDIGGWNTPATPAETTSESTTYSTTSSESEETKESVFETTETSQSSSETTSETSESTETTETTETTVPSETTAVTSETTPTESSSASVTETTEANIPAPSVTPTPTDVPSPTPLPTSTPTPTPTPRPANTRVDFSEFTTNKVNEAFVVNTEDFSESVDADSKPLAVFSGKRMIVSKEGNDNVAEAVNLILDSYYQEAAGLYTRYSGEAKAAYNLSGVIDTVYNIEVNYEYSFNKRILSVIMSYKVTSGTKVLVSSEESASFDMLTGQYVTLASVASDWNGLQNALRDKLAKNLSIKKPAAITDLYVTAQQPGAQTATIEIYGVYDGKVIHTTGDMNEYVKYLNRYGKIIYGVSEDNGNAQ